MKKFFVFAVLNALAISGCDDDDDADAGLKVTPNQSTINGMDVKDCQDEFTRFTACGGDPVGKWSLVANCLGNGEDIYNTSWDVSCALAHGGATSMNGTFVINSDNTMTNSVNSSTEIQLIFDTHCLSEESGMEVSCMLVAQIFGQALNNITCKNYGNDCLCSVGNSSDYTSNCKYELTSESSVKVMCETSEEQSNIDITDYQFCVKDDLLYLKDSENITILKKIQ